MAAHVWMYSIWRINPCEQVCEIIFPTILTSSTVWFRYNTNIISFFQKLKLFFETIVIKNTTAGSIPSLVLFVIYSNLNFNKWKKSAFTSSNNFPSLFTSHKWCAYGEVTFKSQISLNWIKVSSIWCFITSSTLLSFLIFLVTPKKPCVSPVLITWYQKYSLMSSAISATTFWSTCNSLLSSIYHTMVHFFPSIILLATHISYVLILKPKSFKVFT